jgi:hypothetical protein
MIALLRRFRTWEAMGVQDVGLPPTLYILPFHGAFWCLAASALIFRRRAATAEGFRRQLPLRIFSLQFSVYSFDLFNSKLLVPCSLFLVPCLHLHSLRHWKLDIRHSILFYFIGSTLLHSRSGSNSSSIFSASSHIWSLVSGHLSLVAGLARRSLTESRLAI